ncbi:hypothetical protein [Pseudoduganella sp. RAF53_2]|uniref:hypothetical protein n=1 Tax=unclassified Pseudoduganella TaxID=2637179 RepID=UPI003F98C59E
MTARLALLLAILWASTLLWTYRFAVTNTTNAAAAEQSTQLVVGIEKHDQKANAGLAVETKTSAKLARTEANFQKLEQRVLNYAQTHAGATDCGLDADGLRTWVAANADDDAGTEPASPTDRRLPGPAATAGRTDDKPAEQPCSGCEALPQMPGASARPGAVD